MAKNIHVHIHDGTQVKDERKLTPIDVESLKALCKQAETLAKIISSGISTEGVSPSTKSSARTLKSTVSTIEQDLSKFG